MFVVCGEALIDGFGGADNAQGLLLDAHIGGSPLNVAIGLARPAQPVAFFGAVSTGFLGQRLVASGSVCLARRLLREGGGAGGANAAYAGRTRAPALPDRLRPEHPSQCRA